MIRYIDLFSGIGGFHQALSNLGGFECVFASEIDSEAAAVYTKNHGIVPHGDITKIAVNDVPKHDLICAGFPCQPFSKGGLRNGFDDTRGTLFFDIVRIAKALKPRYLLLENVANIVNHDGGHTYRTIVRTLNELGYATSKVPLIISPHNLGIPVHRPRVFFLCILDAQNDDPRINVNVSKIKYTGNEITSYFKFGKSSETQLMLTNYEMKVLKMWDEFYKIIDQRIIGFPIWFDWFKADYSLENYPGWKVNFIHKNKDLYERNKSVIDRWIQKHDELNWVKDSHRKFEWQCGKDCSGVFDGLIQFRPSGVRVKRLNYFSTLVAMNQPQIVGPLCRRLSSDETKLLQSFPVDFEIHPNRGVALKQLGNAVNVKVVEHLVRHLLGKAE
jgi:DNA (cytosine-5)-methyltransferase 1